MKLLLMSLVISSNLFGANAAPDRNQVRRMYEDFGALVGKWEAGEYQGNEQSVLKDLRHVASQLEYAKDPKSNDVYARHVYKVMQEALAGVQQAVEAGKREIDAKYASDVRRAVSNAQRESEHRREDAAWKIESRSNMINAQRRDFDNAAKDVRDSIHYSLFDRAADNRSHLEQHAQRLKDANPNLENPQDDADRTAKTTYDHMQGELKKLAGEIEVSRKGKDEAMKQVEAARQKAADIMAEHEADRKQREAEQKRQDDERRKEQLRERIRADRQFEFEDDVGWQLQIVDHNLNNGHHTAAADVLNKLSERVRAEEQHNNPIQLDGAKKRIEEARKRVHAAAQRQERGAARGGNNNKSFYDNHKTVIWIGSGLFVAGLAYFVAQKLGWIGEEKQPEKETAKA